MIDRKMHTVGVLQNLPINSAKKNIPWKFPSIHPLQGIFDCEIDREIDLQDVQICFMVWLCLDMWYPVLPGVTSISKRGILSTSLSSADLFSAQRHCPD